MVVVIFWRFFQRIFRIILFIYFSVFILLWMKFITLFGCFCIRLWLCIVFGSSVCTMSLRTQWLRTLNLESITIMLSQIETKLQCNNLLMLLIEHPKPFNSIVSNAVDFVVEWQHSEPPNLIIVSAVDNVN